MTLRNSCATLRAIGGAIIDSCRIRVTIGGMKRHQLEQIELPLACPKCGITKKIRVAWMGKTIVCQRCDQRFIIAPVGIPLGKNGSISRATLEAMFGAKSVDTVWVGAALDQLNAGIDEVIGDGTHEHDELIATIRSLDCEAIRVLEDDDLQAMALLAISGLMASAQRIEQQRAEQTDWEERI